MKPFLYLDDMRDDRYPDADDDNGRDIGRDETPDVGDLGGRSSDDNQKRRPEDMYDTGLTDEEDMGNEI